MGHSVSQAVLALISCPKWVLPVSFLLANFFHQYKPQLEASGQPCLLWQALQVARVWGPWAFIAPPKPCTGSF